MTTEERAASRVTKWGMAIGYKCPYCNTYADEQTEFCPTCKAKLIVTLDECKREQANGTWPKSAL